MASDTNPEFEKFWALHGTLALESIADGNAKQVCRMLFAGGQWAALEKSEQCAGREAQPGVAAPALPTDTSVPQSDVAR